MESSCIANKQSLYKTPTSSKQTHKPQNVICNSLDELVAFYDENGRYFGSQQKKREVNVRTVRPSSLEDARSIVNIYDKVYEGMYPYVEMLDEQWVHTSFSNPNYFWGVFRIDEGEDNPETGKIVGCFTLVSNFQTKTAYFRGLNVLPEYQRKVGVRELGFRLVALFFGEMGQKIDNWYAECLTVHPISQLLSRAGGSHCEAIFLNKDYCKGKKTSVAMMVGYWDRILENRECPKYLLPEIMPFHNRACNIHGLRDITEVIENSDIEVDIREVYRVTKNAKSIITKKRFNYYDIEFIDEDTGDYIKALYTPSVKNIEKITYQCSNESILMGLFMLLKNFAKENNVEYIEWQMRASDYVVIDFLLIHDFQVLGYVPAWIPAVNSEKFEDVVMMGWTHKIPDYDSIKTIEEGYSLLDLILKNNYSRCELELAMHEVFASQILEM
ncbi:MAG: hypothetical protein ACTSWL_01355 [Promethearchaeota archaeon]